MNSSGQDIWRAVAEAFGRLRGRKALDLWLGDARPVSFRRGLFTLDVANEAAKAAIDVRYRTDLETLFRELTGSPVRLQTRVVELTGTTERSPPRAASPCAPLAESLAVTEANRLAVAAIERFVLAPEGGFNVLCIYGPPGCGKTELGRHALAELAAAGAVHDPLVVSGEALARDVYHALRYGKLAALHRDWARRDTLLLDEAHRLRGQNRAQRELVALVRRLVEQNGRVLVLSRHAPKQITGIDERLLSYVQSGMVVPVGDPDVADRLDVLRNTRASLEVDIEAGVLEMIAERCPGTLADVVGLLGQLAAEAASDAMGLELERVEHRLRQTLPGADSMDSLLDAVSRNTGVSLARIRSTEKARDAAGARHLVVYLAVRSLGLSARQVCRHLGLKSPSVAAYAKRSVDQRRRRDDEFDRLVHTLQARLEGAQRDLAW